MFKLFFVGQSFLDECRFKLNMSSYLSLGWNLVMPPYLTARPTVRILPGAAGGLGFPKIVPVFSQLELATRTAFHPFGEAGIQWEGLDACQPKRDLI